MMAGHARIFRRPALQHYSRRREDLAVPRLAHPPVRAISIAIAGLLVIGALIAWHMTLPVYTEAWAIVLPGDEISEPAADLVALASISAAHPPPDAVHELILTIGARGQTLRLPVIAVEQDDPRFVAARARLESSRVSAAAPDGENFIVIARVDPLVNPPLLLGGVYPARVQTGSESILRSLVAFDGTRRGQ